MGNPIDRWKPTLGRGHKRKRKTLLTNTRPEIRRQKHFDIEIIIHLSDNLGSMVEREMRVLYPDD